MFPDSHGFEAVPVTRSKNFVFLSALISRDKIEQVYTILFVTGISTKQQLSGNMFPNIKTCKNLDSYHQIYQFKLFTVILYSWGVRSDHMRFSVLSPLIEKSMTLFIIIIIVIIINITQTGMQASENTTMFTKSQIEKPRKLENKLKEATNE